MQSQVHVPFARNMYDCVSSNSLKKIIFLIGAYFFMLIGFSAHAAALESLAAQQEPEDLPHLLKLAQDPKRVGQHGIVRAGAIRALGQTRSEPAFDLLHKWIESPFLNHERCRPWLFTSLATCATWLSPNHSRRATEILIQHLNEENDQSRWRVVLGLVILEAKSAVSALLASESLWDARDFHAVKRKIRDIRESVGGGIGMTPQKIKSMMKMLEGLETRLGGLEGKNRERESLEKVKKEVDEI